MEKKILDELFTSKAALILSSPSVPLSNKSWEYQTKRFLFGWPEKDIKVVLKIRALNNGQSEAKNRA